MVKYFKREVTRSKGRFGNYKTFFKVLEIRKVTKNKELENLNKGLKIKFQEIEQQEYKELKEKYIIKELLFYFKNELEINKIKIQNLKSVTNFDIE